MSIKVVDLNEEVKEEQPALEPIEEAPEEKPVETEPDVANEVVEETIEEPVKEVKGVKPRAKPKAKPKASDIVQCPDCFRSMTYKNLRYSHKCSPEPPPVKKQAKPKAKQTAKPKPKPPPQIYYSDEEEEEEYKPLSKPVRNQVLKPQPINPTTALAQHYQLLQQQHINQKKEKYNNLCQNMFSSKTKKI